MKPLQEDILAKAGFLNSQQPQLSSNSFALLVESITDYAIFMLDVNGIITTWNAGAKNIKGYDANEVIGKPISIFYTAEDVLLGKPVQNLLAAAQNARYHEEGWRVKKDRSLFWADVSFTALRNEKGQLLGFAKVTRDITERKKAEDQLLLLAAIVENSSDAILSTTPDFRIITWNPAAFKMYGFTAEEAIGIQVKDLLKPQMSPSQILDLRRLIADKGFYKGEVTHLKKDGDKLPVAISISAKRGANYEIKEYIVIIRDVADRVHAEELVRKKDEEIRRLVERKLNNTLKEVADYKYALDKANSVAITNKDGVIIYANENFCKISQYSKGELIGKDHKVINSGYHSKDFMQNLWDTITKGDIWKGEIRNKRKDGSFYWSDTTIIPFLNENGSPYQYVAIRIDITERKEAEEQLHVLNEQLEDRVNKRTQQLEIANKELESFSYSVSHDLRAPLRAIGGYSKIIQEDYDRLFDNEGKRLLGNIIDNSKKMGRLIDDLLAFSRLGRKELNMGMVDMQKLVRDCIDEVANDKQNNNCNIEMGQLLPCIGDPIMMKQVWLNFLNNAIKYSSKSAEPCICIGSNETESSNVYFIKDNGVGFEMQYAHKLFGVFQRLHSDSEFEGTGVGLALVKRIIDKHYGEVWGEGEPGRGAIFYFSIPKNV